MTELTPEQEKALERLREPFPTEAVNKLPKIPKKLREGPGKVDKTSCRECSGFHEVGPGVVHLDYAGHAYVTERLLDVDITWTWEPFARDPDGSPAMERDDKGAPIGLWINLTVAGMTRPGYGSLERAKADGVKELIGDAIRNAAMRFGCGLEFWKKEVPGRGSDYDDDAPSQPRRSTPKSGDVAIPGWAQELVAATSEGRVIAAARKIDPNVTSLGHLASFDEGQAIALAERLSVPTEAASRGEAAPHVVQEGDEAYLSDGSDLSTKAAAAVEAWGLPEALKGTELDPTAKPEEGGF